MPAAGPGPGPPTVTGGVVSVAVKVPDWPLVSDQVPDAEVPPAAIVPLMVAV